MVEEIIHLLTERNKFLSQFLALNKIQIRKLKAGDYDQLQEFYLTREHILKVVEKIERLIDHQSKEVSFYHDNEKKDVSFLLSEKDSLIKEILEKDLEILSEIGKEKNQIIKNLKAIGKGKKTIRSYHSGSNTTKIDEEA